METPTNTRYSGIISNTGTDEKTLKRAIKTEQKRLESLFFDISPRKKALVQGLFQQAAFMRAHLDVLEAQLSREGFTTLFKQGEKQEPYQRTNPAASSYSRLHNSYLKIISQLTALLPEESAPDELLEFLKG